MKPGDLVSHFRIVQKIGEGGMGEVFIAQDETLKRRVALKTIRTTKKQRTDAHTRFAREARVLSQLDHPHICRIFEYISTDEDDLIVLELIEGRLLTQLGDDLEYAKKLEIAEQIASALVAAHAEGIVHRDLKPGNIMLTRASGVKVLDFGLACVANTEEDITTDPDLPAGEPRVVDWSVSDDSISGFHTEIGRVFGTVQYMAPEQADGESVGPAADMFSFGLVLQEIFTGTPARRLVKQDGLARAAEGFSAPVEGLPSDLTDLITRLKERAPTRRPTALEALRILHRIRSKPERRLRAALIGAAVVLAVGGVTKYTFDLKDQQAETETERKEVESISSYTLGDLHAELRRVQRLPALKGSVNRLLEYYAKIPPESLLPDQIVNYAQALTLVGRLRRETNLEESLDALRAAVKLLDSQPAARVPEATKARLRRYALFEIGEVHQDRSEPELAESAFRSVADLAHDVNGVWEDDPLPAQALSPQAWAGRVQWRIGTLVSARRGQPDEALDHYASAQKSFAAIGQPTPEERYLSAQVEFAIGNVHMERRDWDAALGPLSRHLRISESLAEEDPSNKRWQKEIAFGHSNLGALNREREDFETARAEVIKSVEVWRTLGLHDPGNLAWKNSLADALSGLYDIELKLGHVAKAHEALKEEYELRQVLTERDPTNMIWFRRRTICENNTGDVLETLALVYRAEARAYFAEASTYFTRAVAHSRRLTEANPTDTGFQLDQVVMLRRLGMNLTDLGDFGAAQGCLEEALGILKQEQTSEKPRKSWLIALAKCRNNLAELRLARNELDLADKELGSAEEVLNHPALAGEGELTKEVRALILVSRSSLLESREIKAEAEAQARAALKILDGMKSFTGRRARASVIATRIAYADAAAEALLDRIRSKGYGQPASVPSPKGN